LGGEVAQTDCLCGSAAATRETNHRPAKAAGLRYPDWTSGLRYPPPSVNQQGTVLRMLL